MSQSQHDLAKEIVIVKRRRGGDEEAHHGGVWKIAYADFMTAMMAFFLVMWLVNMTDDKTITQIANYFNPIQLTDRSPTEKGVYDADPQFKGQSPSGKEDTDSTTHERVASPGKRRMENARREKAAAEEAKLFIDPMKTLDDVAASPDALIQELGDKDKLAGLAEERLRKQKDILGTDIFDPFDPMVKENEGRSAEAGEPVMPDKSASVVENVPKLSAGSGEKQTSLEADEGATEPASNPGGRGVEEVDGPSGGDKHAQNGAPSKEMARQAEAVAQSILEALRTLKSELPSIGVEATPEGVLVSIMDNAAFEMFRIGSAEPTPRAVAVIDKLGRVIKQINKGVVVRGHTDAAPFKNSGYDNWRLSTARAHMAHYMLRRAGIQDGRIERIEGFAASQLRNKSDPLAAENRRIELLVKVPAS